MYKLKLIMALVLIISQEIDITKCALTEEQMLQTLVSLRAACQPQFKVTDEIIDGLKMGKFPDDKELMCYVNCVLEYMNAIRKGKLNVDGMMKQINLFLPEDMRDDYLNGIEKCKDTGAGMKDNCAKSYSLLQCFSENNPKFLFP